MKLGQNDIRR